MLTPDTTKEEETPDTTKEETPPDTTKEEETTPDTTEEGDTSTPDTTKEEEKCFPQWKALTQVQISQLLRKSAAHVHSEFAKIHFLRLKEPALLDYYVCGFCWAKDAGFSPTQTSFTMAVLHMLVENIMKKMGFVENLMEFCKVLSDTTPLVHREQTTGLIDYVRLSLFNKYRLYQIFFTTAREILVISRQRTVEVIMKDTFAPLEEGRVEGDTEEGDAEQAEEPEQAPAPAPVPAARVASRRGARKK